MNYWFEKVNDLPGNFFIVAPVEGGFFVHSGSHTKTKPKKKVGSDFWCYFFLYVHRVLLQQGAFTVTQTSSFLVRRLSHFISFLHTRILAFHVQKQNENKNTPKRDWSLTFFSANENLIFVSLDFSKLNKRTDGIKKIKIKKIVSNKTIAQISN